MTTSSTIIVVEFVLCFYWLTCCPQFYVSALQCMKCHCMWDNEKFYSEPTFFSSWAPTENQNHESFCPTSTVGNHCVQNVHYLMHIFVFNLQSLLHVFETSDCRPWLDICFNRNYNSHSSSYFHPLSFILHFSLLHWGSGRYCWQISHGLAGSSSNGWLPCAVINNEQVVCII